MRISAFTIAGFLALTASAQLSAAQTQQAAPCVTGEEMRGMVSFFLPSVLDSTITTCKSHLPADAYLSARGPKLVEQLSADKETAWPLAKAAFMKIGENTGDDRAKLLSAVPDEMVRPIIEDAIAAKLAPSIKPANCADIDRIAATMEPLPKANLVALVAEIFNVAARDSKKIPSCPVGG